MLAAEWDAQAELFEPVLFSGIVPVLFAENPAIAEVAFLADRPTARRDLDRMMRALFHPELITGHEAIEVCRRPRIGEAVYAYKLANLTTLKRPAPRVRVKPTAEVQTSTLQASPLQAPGTSGGSASKRPRLDVVSDSGRIFSA